MDPTTKASAVASGPARQSVRQFMHRLTQKRLMRHTAQPPHTHTSTNTRPRLRRAAREMNAETLEALSACRQRAVALLVNRPAAATDNAEAQTAGAASTSPETASTHAQPTGERLSAAGCFSQVVPEETLRTAEGDVGNTLCGLTAAVSDVLRVREFAASDPTILRQLSGQKELPLVSWMRRHGALILAELASHTPLSVHEAAVFGPHERSAQAVVSGACHYAFTTSLLGPPALGSCVGQDVVGFKPTAQTFGTFTEDFKMPISAMTVGITAGAVDDLLYLWQHYTASIDSDIAEAVQDEAAEETATSSPERADEGRTHEANTSQHGQEKEAQPQFDTPLTEPDPHAHDAATGSDPRVTPAAQIYADPGILDHSPSNYTIQPDARDAPFGKATHRSGTGKGTMQMGTQRRISFHLQHSEKTTHAHDTFAPDHEYNALRPPGHTRWSPKRTHGGLADVDVGWRDYNATAMRESYRRVPSSPGWWRHVVFGGSRDKFDDGEAGTSADTWLTRALPFLANGGRGTNGRASNHPSRHGSRSAGGGDGSGAPLVELTVGYPSEWLDGPCQLRYGGSEAFRMQLARMVYTRSALHKDRKMEIVPLAIDLDLEEVLNAVQVIARYETARAFERLLPARLAEGQNKKIHLHQHEERLVAPALGTSVDSGRAPSTGALTDAGQPGAPQSSSLPSTHSVPSTGTSSTATSSLSQRPASSALALLASALQELPPDVLRVLDEGQRVSLYAYHRALRTRDEVVRVTEDHFQDVDMLVVPMLCAPYDSGSLESLLPALPFHLAGHPMVSLQLTEQMPVVLVEQPGRDAALLEDAYRFVQLARGSSPKWWQ